MHSGESKIIALGILLEINFWIGSLSLGILMKNKFFILFLLLILFSAFSYSLNVQHLKFSHCLYGNPLQTKYVRENVVVVVFWKKSSATLSLTSRFLKKYKNRGLVMFGVYVDFQGYGKAYDLLRKNRISYPHFIRCSNNRGRLVDLSKEIAPPFAWVFGTDGNRVYKGNVKTALKKAKILLRKCPLWLLKNAKFEHKITQKALKRIKKALLRGRGLDSIYRYLEKISKKTLDSKLKSEMAALLMRLNSFISNESQKLDFIIKENQPLFLRGEYKHFYRLFGKIPTAKSLGKKYESRLRSREFKKLYEAAILYKTVKVAFFKLKPARHGQKVDLSDPKCLKKNANIVRQILYYSSILRKKHPNTLYAKAVLGLILPLMKTRKKSK